jgi:polar amino acid transport system substrate-binding protein
MKKLASFALALLLAGCATMGGTMSEKARSALAPTGKLRAGMNLGNVVLTQKDPATGALRGVSVDVVQELGRRLGVPVEYVMYPTPGDVAAAVDKGEWDVAVLAIEATRAEKIAFSPGMTEIEVGFLVPPDSKLRNASEVDNKGVRIAVSSGAGYEVPLKNSIKQATVISVKGGQPAVFEAFKSQGLEAYIALKPALADFVPRMPGSRILDGRFTSVQHGIGTPRKNAEAAEYVRYAVEEMKASGLIARSVERSGVRGLQAAKP